MAYEDLSILELMKSSVLSSQLQVFMVVKLSLPFFSFFLTEVINPVLSMLLHFNKDT